MNTHIELHYRSSSTSLFIPLSWPVDYERPRASGDCYISGLGNLLVYDSQACTAAKTFQVFENLSTTSYQLKLTIFVNYWFYEIENAVDNAIVAMKLQWKPYTTKFIVFMMNIYEMNVVRIQYF